MHNQISRHFTKHNSADPLTKIKVIFFNDLCKMNKLKQKGIIKL